MYESGKTTTVAIKPCQSCGLAILEESRFCRVCGAAQTYVLTTGSLATTPSDAVEGKLTRQYVTTPLSPRGLYHPVSGPLVTAVVAGVPARTQPSPADSPSRRMLLALMAVPIWVMIILLSPLDAYTSAKIIGNRI
jgi:hypothetical protein